jgi:hypothetical protein
MSSDERHVFRGHYARANESSALFADEDQSVTQIRKRTQLPSFGQLARQTGFGQQG